MANVVGDFRSVILSRLQERNDSEFVLFDELVSSHNKLFDSTSFLKLENLQLTIQNEKLRQENLDLQCSKGITLDGKPIGNERIQVLEHKIFTLQEELTDLHRRKGDHAQQLIDLSHRLQDKEKETVTKDHKLGELEAKLTVLKAENKALETAKLELETANQLIRDEHQALQLAFAAMEESLRRTAAENRELIDRLIRIKAVDADLLNAENDNFLRRRQAQLQKELEEAANEVRVVHPEKFPIEVPDNLSSTLPSQPLHKLDAHEGEVNAIRWHPSGRILASGGGDRKIKLWDVGPSVGSMQCKGVLTGSSAGITCLEFDYTGTLILGASNDFATRVWNVDDQRLRHTLTGHSGKVLAAKFFGDPSKVVTGSHDRTLKIWDLRSRVCTCTKFAGSSCNDLVTIDGMHIISGHFDRRIRFWDYRTESSHNEIVLQGKVTSLDLSRDKNYILTCVRDDTLKVIDLRMNQIIGTYCDDGFKVGCDWTRAVFSPSGQYLAVGSSDGVIFIWNVATCAVEKQLKEHSTAVIAVAWQPNENTMASCDKSKRLVVWGDGFF